MTTDFSQIESSIVDVKKRDGRITAFNKEKITSAIYKALVANGQPDHKIAEDLTSGVSDKLIQQGFSASNPPSVEDVQDMVESTLIEKGLSEIAKAYILYRHERRKVREDKMKVLNTKNLDTVSKSFDLGLANCPAILPTLITGKLEKYCKTAAICKIVLIRLRIESAVAAANVSAQSPPCNQNALPSAASAILDFKLSHSPAKTKGGKVFKVATESANAFLSGHSGC